MEQRDSMQKYNLVYDENTKKYCLPFDNSELSNCEFVKHNFLGKPKLCIIDNKVLNPKDSMDFVYKDTLMKNFEVNFSEKINSSIRNTMVPRTRSTSATASALDRSFYDTKTDKIQALRLLHPLFANTFCTTEA